MRPVCFVRPIIAALVLAAAGIWVGQALAQPSLQPPLQPAQPTLRSKQPSRQSAKNQPGLLPQASQSDAQAANKSPADKPSADTSGADKAADDKTEKPKLSPADQAIREAFQKSKTASTLDDYNQMISLCQEGIQKGAGEESATYAKKLEGWAHNRRGEKYSDAGDERKALQDFDTALQLDPTLWKAVHNRGVSKANLGDKPGAIADFDRAIRMNSGYANAWYNRGELKYDQGDYQGAVQDLSRAIDLEPQDAAYYNSRGHAEYRLGQLREALMDYDRAVQIDPNDASAVVNRGDAYREQSMYGRAAADYRDAIRLNPKLGRAYLQTAWIMATCPEQQYRDADRGLAAAEKAIELDGDKDYRYLDTLAAAQANAGKFDDAKATESRAISRAPEKAASKLQQRLGLYQNSKAYREGAPPEPVRSATRP